MQGRQLTLARMTLPFTMSLFSLVAQLAFPITARADDENGGKTGMSLTADNSDIANLRRFSYRIRLEPRGERLRVYARDWPYDRDDVSRNYNGKISVTTGSEVLDRLLRRNQPFELNVRVAASTEGESGGNVKLVFLGCKVLEKEVQISKRGTIITTYFFSADELAQE